MTASPSGHCADFDTINAIACRPAWPWSSNTPCITLATVTRAACRATSPPSRAPAFPSKPWAATVRAARYSPTKTNCSKSPVEAMTAATTISAWSSTDASTSCGPASIQPPISNPTTSASGPNILCKYPTARLCKNHSNQPVSPPSCISPSTSNSNPVADSSVSLPVGDKVAKQMNDLRIYPYPSITEQQKVIDSFAY